jgi:WD40 repeat protein
LLPHPPLILQRQVAAFEGHDGGAACLAFSQNGFYAAVGAAGSGGSASVKLWDLRKLAAVSSVALPGAGAPGATAVAFDASGGWLAAGSAGGAVAVWGTKEAAAAPGAEPAWTAPGVPGAPVTALAWGPLARSLLVAGGGKAAPLRVFTTASA